MLNEVYDTIAAILESLDAGGEQSRAFADEITMLKEVLGDPEPGADALDETLRRCRIARKLARLAVEAEAVAVPLPTLPVNQWTADTFQNPAVRMSLEPCDLAGLF